MSDILRDSFKTIIIPYFNFLVFFGLFIYFFKKPLSEIFSKKRSQYLDDSKTSQALKNDAMKQLAELKDRMARSDIEMKQLVDLSKSSTAKETEKLLAEARDLSKRMIEDSQKSVQFELKRLKLDLFEEVTQMVREKLESQVEGKFSKENHEKVILKNISQLEQRP